MPPMPKSKLRLYCFSPPVMLATFLIEIIGAIYVLWHYKLTPASRLIAAILLSLAAFQGAEYMLCGGFGIQGGTWSKLGYSAITLLPPLGIHLAHVIAGKQNKPLVYTAYATAAAFVAYFAFYTPAITGHTCYANYAAFSGDGIPYADMVYAAYYYGWLILGTYLSFKFSREIKQRNLSHALLALAFGYCAFIIPTTAVNIIDPETLNAIPSIMCGFAVLLALVLIGKVSPEILQQKNSFDDLRVRLPF